MKKINLLVIFFITLQSFVFAQDKINEKEGLDTIEEYTEQDFQNIKLERIKRLRNELVKIRSEVNLLKKSISDDVDMVVRIPAEIKIKKLNEEYIKKRYLFIETITNINLNNEKLQKNKTSFSEDIKQILEPALNTFKRISEKPRKAQEYNDLMNVLQEQYNNAVLAREKLTDFLDVNKVPALKWKLKESIKSTEKKIDKLKVQLEDIRFKILKLQKNERSIVTTFSEIILDFIKTKGKNLLLAFFVFISLFWTFKFGQSKFIDLVLYRFSNSEAQEMYHWIVRPTRVIYSVVSTLIAFFLAILTLYVLNDWVLVTLILFLFAALIWSSKEYLPVFFEQSKIILNLGSIREGERVMYKDLPWEIQSLGYYCRLVNPALSAARLRVNTRDLLTATSRRSEVDEPWFPTSKGDWVLIGGDFAQVVFQSPDQVIVKSIGSEKKFYPAKDFYTSAPVNLSHGFCIEFEFGVDYSHQRELFSRIIPLFKENIQRELANNFPELKGLSDDFIIDLAQANSSSLDLRFFMKCHGEIAHLRPALKRSIQAEFVKVCNANEIIIPFNQLTVHMQK